MNEKAEDDHSKVVAVIVAHPDDETLWAGGTLFTHTRWDCFILSLCRGKDLDRAPKFAKALKQLNAKGKMGNLEDGPDQKPLPEKEVEQLILDLLPAQKYDLIITHNPNGEYTRHLRHEETSKSVILLWNSGKILAETLWTFAYTDDHREHFPTAVTGAPLCFTLPPAIWKRKYNIIRETYGFEKESWEAKTTPETEAFWVFNTASEAAQWLEQGGKSA